MNILSYVMMTSGLQVIKIVIRTEVNLLFTYSFRDLNPFFHYSDSLAILLFFLFKSVSIVTLCVNSFFTVSFQYCIKFFLMCVIKLRK